MRRISSSRSRSPYNRYDPKDRVVFDPKDRPFDPKDRPYDDYKRHDNRMYKDDRVYKEYRHENNNNNRGGYGQHRDERINRDTQQRREYTRSRSRSRSRSPHHPLSNPEDTLYVSNMGPKIKEDKLQERFGKYGRILDINIIKDPFTGDSRGFGFIKFASIANANDAQKALDGKELEGRVLKIGKARHPTGHKPTPGQYMGDQRQISRSKFSPPRHRSRSRSFENKLRPRSRSRSRSFDRNNRKPVRDRSRERDRRPSSHSRERERFVGERDRYEKDRPRVVDRDRFERERFERDRDRGDRDRNDRDRPRTFKTGFSQF